MVKNQENNGTKEIGLVTPAPGQVAKLLTARVLTRRDERSLSST